MDFDVMGDNLQAFTRMWGDLAGRMVNAGLSFNPLLPPAENADRVRRASLSVLSEFAEQFMRSPQFLDFMKKSMDAAMGLREQVDETLTGVRHDSQGIAREDIDSLMMTVRQLGGRIFDRLDELEARLDAIDHRLDSVGGRGGEANGKANAARSSGGKGGDRPKRAGRAAAHRRAKK